MSDIQDLICKTTLMAIDEGKKIERERIIKLLANKIQEFEQLLVANPSHTEDNNIPHLARAFNHAILMIGTE